VENKLSLSHTMSSHEHIEQIARICNQRFYLLQQMRKEGLHDDCLKILFHAIILSKVLYALSALGGYNNVGRVNKLLRKAKRYSFIDTLLTFSELKWNSLMNSYSHVLFVPNTVYTICMIKTP